MTRILVVDDEPRFREILRFNLESEGHEVVCAASGEEAVELFPSVDPGMVVLDLMLGGIDGFEVCRRIRETSSCPIIIVTAKGADADKVRGLRLGADDYLTKPYSAQELIARVEAVLRRAQPVAAVPVERRQDGFRSGDLAIDFLAKHVTVAGRDVRLSPIEYRLLCALAARPGSLLAHDELLEQVWGEAYRGESEILRVTLWRLRQKLGDDPSAPRFIVTRPGLGYLLAAPDDL